MSRISDLAGFTTALSTTEDLSVGIITASTFSGNLTGDVTGNADTATTATNAQGLTGSPDITVTNISAGIATLTGAISATNGTFSGNVNIGGTLTYQDVEHIDSVGIITAQQGIQVLANGLDVTGVSTFKSNVSIADSILHTGDTDTAIRFPSADTFTVHTNGSERTRVDGDGRLLVATSSASGTHKLQVNGSAQIRVGESLILQNAAGSAEGSIECAGAGSNTDIRIRTNSTERLRVTHAGNIGIGSASPGFPVVIYADANRNSIAIRNAGSGTEEGRLYWYASDNTTIRAGISGQENGLVLFSGGATERLRITSGGGVHFTNGELIERVNITAGKLSDNTNIDLEDGMAHLFTTTETTTATPNIRVNSSTTLNSVMATGDAISVTIITTAAAAGYSAQLTVDGVAVTEKWNGGSAPSAGGASGNDYYTYNIIKTGDAAYTVLANVANFA